MSDQNHTPEVIVRDDDGEYDHMPSRLYSELAKEPGLLDLDNHEVPSPAPRPAGGADPAELAAMLRECQRGTSHDRPVIDGDRWWCVAAGHLPDLIAAMDELAALRAAHPGPADGRDVLLRLAAQTIEGLAAQQAMDDPWYMPTLRQIRQAIAFRGAGPAAGRGVVGWVDRDAWDRRRPGDILIVSTHEPADDGKVRLSLTPEPPPEPAPGLEGTP